MSDIPGSMRRSGLVRPRSGRVLGGVCAGVAHRFGLNPWGVRLLWLLICLIPGPQIVIYIALWVLMPSE
ncbi:PspC domain-containing protein [Georgenia deserti]|uniref:PspC domain-containing protein n=1 Tax=Georgenia deserti TaxID=2093781 RepID=A0ABW4L842_9MICO